MNRFDREISRRNLKKRKQKALGLYGKYTRDEDISKCKCKKHVKV